MNNEHDEHEEMTVERPRERIEREVNEMVAKIHAGNVKGKIPEYPGWTAGEGKPAAGTYQGRPPSLTRWHIFTSGGHDLYHISTTASIEGEVRIDKYISRGNIDGLRNVGFVFSHSVEEAMQIANERRF